MRTYFTVPLLFSALISVPMASHAQGLSRSDIGIKAGAQWCRLAADGVPYTAIPGGVLGAYAPFLVRARLEIQPELVASYQGSDLQIPEAAPATARMLYVQLPVAVKVFLSNTFNLQAGPQAAWCAAAWSNGESAKDLVRPFEVGLFGGLGLDMRTGWDLCARYYYGMKPVLIGDHGTNPRHRIIQVGLGYRMMHTGGRKHRLHRR